MEDTTIKLKKTTKDRLEELKIHPNQSYDEVLNILLDKKQDGDINASDKSGQ